MAHGCGRRTMSGGLIALTLAPCLALLPQSAYAQDAATRKNLAWQIALERVAFSPGVIDGKIGRKTRLATREFQRVHGLPISGKLDNATAERLGVDPDDALAEYAIKASDFSKIGGVPKGWVAKSKLKRLGYESLEAALAEKFHCSRGALGRLNPGRSFAQLKAGDRITVPVIVEEPGVRGHSLEIDLGEKIIRVLNKKRQLVGLFHCSIAAHASKRPSGQAKVVSVTEDPTYVFDPAMWPEVTGVDKKLVIPPGPRNPVGRCWIGLSLPGYGIHGTPNPELIGKTGSHGCFRLTNWDALRLGKMLRPGARVRFKS